MTETTQHWMLSAEKEVLCERTSSVLGLAVLFASYYNFNLQYQHDAACTLEFIQRYELFHQTDRWMVFPLHHILHWCEFTWLNVMTRDVVKNSLALCDTRPCVK